LEIRFQQRHPDIAIDQLAEPTPTQRRAFELLDSPIPLRISNT
jgi:hypothetical protein